MGRRTEELLAELKDEEARNNTTPTETPEEPPKETAAEPAPQEEPGQPEEPAQPEKPEDVPEEPEKSKDEPKDAPPKKKDIPDDPLKRAEFSFRRQLEKNNEKHKKELAERDERYKAMEAELAELKKQVAPKEPAKSRKDFATDDEYIEYIVQQRTAQELDKFREESAKAKKAADEETAKKQAADEELERQQRAWLDNVGEAFGGDNNRVKAFLDKVNYAQKNGLGQILDACPAAADYLFNNPKGPVVMEKLVNDRGTFMEVFGNGHASQLDVYYALRKVEEKLSAPVQPTAATPQKKTMPAIGRPGRQAGGGSAPDIFSDDDALRSYIRGLR